MIRPILLKSNSLTISVILTAMLLMIDIVWVLASPLSFDWGSVALGLSVPAGILLYAAFYTFVRPAERISNMSVNAVVLILFSHIGCVYGYLIATSPLPLQDELFVSIDSFFGFDWVAYSRFVFSSTTLRVVSLIFYNLTLPLVVFTIIWLSFKGKTTQSRDFVLTIIVGAIVCISISWFLPAAGAVGYFAPDESLYGGLPIIVDLEYKQDYFELRKGMEFVISLSEPKGFVAFPSYHVCMAILIILAFRNEGAVLWIMLMVNSLTIASTPIDGGHHLSDVLGGLFVGVVCFLLVRMFVKDNSSQNG